MCIVLLFINIKIYIIYNKKISVFIQVLSFKKEISITRKLEKQEKKKSNINLKELKIEKLNVNINMCKNNCIFNSYLIAFKYYIEYYLKNYINNVKFQMEYNDTFSLEICIELKLYKNILKLIK